MQPVRLGGPTRLEHVHVDMILRVRFSYSPKSQPCQPFHPFSLASGIRVTRPTPTGKVELLFLENELLGTPLGKAEKCELRIEGMTRGSCVEVCFTT